MIVEGLVTTTDAAAGPHLAPMGPRVEGDFAKLLFRPFRTSTTYKHLVSRRHGVFHITDDVGLIARAAVSRLAQMPPTRPATRISGFVLTDACRAFEFEVVGIDESHERVSIDTAVVRRHDLRPFVGFQRAKHAVLEAAILATRLHILPRGEVVAELRKLRVIVDKTAGPAEFEAMTFLEEFVAEFDGRDGGPA